MRVVNLLNFLRDSKALKALEYAQIDCKKIDLLNLVENDSQFMQSFDLGILFLINKSAGKYKIVDGFNRLISLSLLLHAICECYKKTSKKNQKGIDIIRKKYLYFNKSLKLILKEKDAIIYNKILTGERLSGKEKKHQLFLTLHNYWIKIKEKNLRASDMLKTLNKIQVTIIETPDYKVRDTYYKLNENNKLNQITFIDDYLKELGLQKEWNDIKELFTVNINDVNLFLQDFLITKFNYKNFDNKALYIYFQNYFETMLKYNSEDNILASIKKYAYFYNNILNLNFENVQIKNALINIKKMSGEDTFAYLLDVYADFMEGYITENTFIEILETVQEYLKNRSTLNDVNFNELINYLTAFVSCK